MLDWTPTLVVVSGPAGSGKTTLAHALARQIGCPAVCRDEIKEGMTLAAQGAEPSPDLTHRTFTLFFEVIARLLVGGVTVVAEAAFQDSRWRPQLERLRPLADVRVIRCWVDDDTSLNRVESRLRSNPRRAAHADEALLARRRSAGQSTVGSFVWIALDVPALDVDTTTGYQPSLGDIAAFATI